MHVSGMALWPFILLADEKLRHNKRLLNHEKIHHKQQVELLIIPFYILYIINYLYNLLRFKDHDKAYRNIIFEREAYHHESNFGYLSKRRSFAWIYCLS